MRCIDLIAQFELEINKLDDLINKPVTDDTVYWINQGMMKFVKERFNGNLPHRTSYEQNEKRTEDLVKLFRETTVREFNKTEHASYDSYEWIYPPEMMFVLNEDVLISDLNGDHIMDTCIFECTADSFMYRINNSLTDFHYRYHRARPLRVRTNDGFKLLTDKKYKIHQYTLGYLATPEEVKGIDPNTEYNDFSDHTWAEIIKIAAQMYIENQSDPRYKTYSAEVATME